MSGSEAGPSTHAHAENRLSQKHRPEDAPVFDEYMAATSLRCRMHAGLEPTFYNYKSMTIDLFDYNMVVQKTNSDTFSGVARKPLLA